VDKVAEYRAKQKKLAGTAVSRLKESVAKKKDYFSKDE